MNEHEATIEALKKEGWKSSEEAMKIETKHSEYVKAFMRELNNERREAVRQARQKTAREIFEEIERNWEWLAGLWTDEDKIMSLKYSLIASLKAKYLTEPIAPKPVLFICPKARTCLIGCDDKDAHKHDAACDRICNAFNAGPCVPVDQEEVEP